VVLYGWPDEPSKSIIRKSTRHEAEHAVDGVIGSGAKYRIGRTVRIRPGVHRFERQQEGKSRRMVEELRVIVASVLDGLLNDQNCVAHPPVVRTRPKRNDRSWFELKQASA
jgi:hypothetical protein